MEILTHGWQYTLEKKGGTNFFERVPYSLGNLTRGPRVYGSALTFSFLAVSLETRKKSTKNCLMKSII